MFQCRVLCKDHSFKWTEWNAAGFPDWKVIYAIGNDVSERKANEMADVANREKTELLAIMN